MIKTQAVSRLKSTSATDSKGAAEFCEALFKKHRLDFTVKSAVDRFGPDEQTDADRVLSVKGKTALGAIQFELSLFQRESGMSINWVKLDGLIPEKFIDSVRDMNAGMPNEVTTSELKYLKDVLNSSAVALKYAGDLKISFDLNTRMLAAFEELKKVIKANKTKPVRPW